MSDIDPSQIVLVAEVCLGDWAHSFHSAKRTTDAKATFFFPSDEDMAPLTNYKTRAGTGKRVTGSRFKMFLVACDDEPAAEQAEPAAEPAAPDVAPPKLYGKQAQDLKLSGFFRAVEVWRAIGSDQEFIAWVTRQPSIMSGAFDQSDEEGDARNIACHVRRAGEAGVSYKPIYACVPMTDAEHQIQHRLGERECYVRCHTRAGSGPFLDNPLPAQAKEWFDKQRIRTVERWAWESLKQTLGFESMAQVHPDLIAEWAEQNGVEKYLPNSYRTIER